MRTRIDDEKYMYVRLLGGNVSENIENAKVYAKYVFNRGMAPVIPHFMQPFLMMKSKLKEILVNRQVYRYCLAVMQFGCLVIK